MYTQKNISQPSYKKALAIHKKTTSILKDNSPQAIQLQKLKDLSQVSLQNQELLQLQKISDIFLDYHPSIIQEKTNYNHPTNHVFQLSRRREEFTPRQKAKILAKNRKKNNNFYTCENCGFKHRQIRYATYRGRRTGDGSFHIDHKVAASHGGRALMGNARVLCGTCNTSKGNRDAAKRTGRSKFRALHGKIYPKDYQIKRRKY
ncbi:MULTISPECIES: HNH endonuclease [Mesonia]|mgnify:FL=1|uniref:Uncharacterized protein n=1 Tax=Mesonia oceanica TaxID=2687242 RepID=A0AC61Y776_9FLAO|nr:MULTISPECIES: HNH endonuclease [Mesonia]MAN28800.1 hypothetical protein [Mesonia sp.]MAQ41868.1 hypothetical protein [Mesonia sp.]MBJ99009.1 hypothetical protein [Flavobacteriaceae bacterium]VVU99209.1 hypothetical protein FVB9532_00461 [Mesonia oceanica]|tara:strand:- start:46011 stop:46622 length:612 start_codon:yes stop_codon:yes gene_type:complete